MVLAVAGNSLGGSAPSRDGAPLAGTLVRMDR